MIAQVRNYDYLSEADKQLVRALDKVTEGFTKVNNRSTLAKRKYYDREGNILTDPHSGDSALIHLEQGNYFIYRDNWRVKIFNEDTSRKRLWEEFSRLHLDLRPEYVLEHTQRLATKAIGK